MTRNEDRMSRPDVPDMKCVGLWPVQQRTLWLCDLSPLSVCVQLEILGNPCPGYVNIHIFLYIISLKNVPHAAKR
jgi:hypothetical protein